MYAHGGGAIALTADMLVFFKILHKYVLISLVIACMHTDDWFYCFFHEYEFIVEHSSLQGTLASLLTWPLLVGSLSSMWITGLPLRPSVYAYILENPCPTSAYAFLVRKMRRIVYTWYALPIHGKARLKGTKAGHNSQKVDPKGKTRNLAPCYSIDLLSMS